MRLYCRLTHMPSGGLALCLIDKHPPLSASSWFCAPGGQRNVSNQVLGFVNSCLNTRQGSRRSGCACMQKRSFFGGHSVYGTVLHACWWWCWLSAPSRSRVRCCLFVASAVVCCCASPPLGAAPKPLSLTSSCHVRRPFAFHLVVELNCVISLPSSSIFRAHFFV